MEVPRCRLSVQSWYEDGPLDVVTGGRLLDYASNGKEMANMFRNASVNLREGGHFIGVTPPPTNDTRGHTKRALGDVAVTITNDVEEGGEAVATHLSATGRTGKVDLDAHHLTMCVYERSAREGGLEGALTWRSVDSPDIDNDVLESLNSPAWGSYLTIHTLACWSLQRHGQPSVIESL